MSDPHSLLNRPPVIYFKGVTGAPGRRQHGPGACQMTTRLPNLGDVVQDTGKPGRISSVARRGEDRAQGAGNTDTDRNPVDHYRR